MAKRKSNAALRCSFCRKTDGETAKLIAGPNELAICAECVHLCAEIVADEPPAPSRIQEITLVLEDGSRYLVAAGLHETVSMLGEDDSRIVAFDLVEGDRIAVRRQAVRQIHAKREPEVEPVSRPSWAD